MVEDTSHESIHTNPSALSNIHYQLPKTPKKIDYWYLTKIEALYREQIDYLKHELRTKEDEITQLRSTNIPSPTNSVPNSVEYKPVGKQVNPARALAEMEIKEREKYWKKIMEEKDKLANTSNTINVDS